MFERAPWTTIPEDRATNTLYFCTSAGFPHGAFGMATPKFAIILIAHLEEMPKAKRAQQLEHLRQVWRN